MATQYMLSDHEGAEAAGFAGFNSGPHLCVDLDGGHFTITCRTPRGKLVTFAFVPTARELHPDDDYECCDVDYANGPGPKIRNGDRNMTSFHMIGFTVGRWTFDTRTDTAPTTLATVLLGEQHYQS